MHQSFACLRTYGQCSLSSRSIGRKVNRAHRCRPLQSHASSPPGSPSHPPGFAPLCSLEPPPRPLGVAYASACRHDTTSWRCRNPWQSKPHLHKKNERVKETSV